MLEKGSVKIAYVFGFRTMNRINISPQGPLNFVPTPHLYSQILFSAETIKRKNKIPYVAAAATVYANLAKYNTLSWRPYSLVLLVKLFFVHFEMERTKDTKMGGNNELGTRA